MGEFLRKCVPRSELEWRLLRARAAYWGWQVMTKVVLGVVYLSIIAEGFRVLVPVLNRRLYRLPLLGWMNDYEGTYELDMASLMSVFMMIAVFTLWSHLLKLWVSEKIGFDHRLRNQNNANLFVLVFAFVVLLSDTVLFFVAVTEVSWSGAGFSFTALFATAAYVSVLVFTIYVSINLHEKIELIEREPLNENRNNPNF